MNFRQQYNYNLKLMYKIENVINNNPSKYDELYPKFEQFTRTLSKLAKECKEKYNYIMTDVEILEGFKKVN